MSSAVINSGVFLFQYISYCILLFASTALSHPDSLHRYRGDTVLVTGISTDSRFYPAPSQIRLTPIDEVLRLSSTASTASAFVYLHPSLDIRAYGTQSNLTLASFRGLPSEYIVVMKNGVRLVSEQNKLTDLAKYTVRSSSRTEVLTGINAALAGADIASASINIESYPIPVSSTVSFGTTTHLYDRSTADGGTESYISVTSPLDTSLGIGSTIVYQKADGQYPFYRQKTRQYITRTNNDGTSLIADIAPYYIISSAQNIRGYLQVNRIERGIPGAVTSDNSGGNSPSARQYDNDLLASLAYNLDGTDKGLSAIVSHSRQYETYNDPNIKIADEYTNTVTAFHCKSFAQLASELTAYLTGDLERYGLESNQNSRADNEPITRTVLRSAGALTYRPTELLRISGLIRFDSYSDIDHTKLLPAFSLEYQTDSYNLGVNIGTVNHAPTFNQLYWKIGGNPQLKTEEGIAVSSWLRSHWNWGNLVGTAGASGFYHKLSNQIIWLPGERGIWSPKNILSSRTTGGDLEVAALYPLSASTTLTLRQQAAYLDSRNLTAGSEHYNKELPYNPRLRLSTSLITATPLGEMTLVCRYRGKRFTDIANEQTTTLPSSASFDILYRSPIVTVYSIQVHLNGSITNLLNKYYEEAPSYPMPGRTFYLGFDARYDFLTND